MHKAKIHLVFALSIATSFFTVGCTQTIRDQKANINSSQNAGTDQKDMMARMQDYATPGESHKALNALIGSWDHTVEFWMDPASPPEKSTGKSEIKWTMGNRFVEHTAVGKSMGQPFQGKGIIGYDKANKQYRTIWYDNMGTGMISGTGSYDSSKKVLTETGTASCPIYGTVNYRGVTTLVDPKHFRYEMFVTAPEQQEVKVMNIEYTKRKSSSK